MPRLLIHVEGQTEEDFVNVVLRDYLVHAGYEAVSARIIGNARVRRRRGGIRPWPPIRKDIINHLRQDSGCLATTMVDYYGLPKEGDRAWPGRAEAAQLEASGKAAHVQNALLGDLAGEMGADFNPGRFIPFVVMNSKGYFLATVRRSLMASEGRIWRQPSKAFETDLNRRKR